MRPARAKASGIKGTGSIIGIPSASTSPATPRRTASSLKRPMRDSMRSARASGANESPRRAREIPPAIAAWSTPLRLNTSMMRSSSPTFTQVSSSTSAESAVAVSFRWATATTRMPWRRTAFATSSGKIPLPAIRPSLFTLAADHSAFGTRDEVDETADLGKTAQLVKDFLERILARKPRVKNRTGRGLQRFYRLGRKAAPLKPDLVDADQPRPFCACHHDIRWYILGGERPGCQEGMRPDPGELVDRGHRTEVSALLDHAMTTKLGAVRQDNIVADPAIVRDVHVVHHQHAIAQLGQHPAALGAAVDAGEFADAAFVTDFQARRLALVFQILGIFAHRGELKDPGPRAD